MKKSNTKIIFFVTVCIWILSAPHYAFATQEHGGIEGVYAHQLAHVFFIISMGSLIYWLRERGLVQQRGWQLIQYSALFFILWNLDTLMVHFLDDQFKIITVKSIGPWQIELRDAYHNDTLKILYYFAKLDHLLCVPALIFLYLGLKRLLKESRLDLKRNGKI
ncbi:MAG: hypothetical protein PVI06_09065 [Desulfobacterales bacterium]|jgi:hypothetical protein